MAGSGPLLSRLLVNRVEEVEILEKSLEHASSGCPQAVMIAGEAGIGKTTICRALLDRSVTLGAVAIVCQSNTDEGSPLCAPLIDELRRVFARVQSVDSSAVPFDAEVGDVHVGASPSPVANFKADAGTSIFRQTPSISSEHTRLLFDWLLSAIHNLADRCGTAPGERSPVVLIIEDLHSAEDATLEFVRFLFRSIARDARDNDVKRPLLVIATYRTEEATEHTSLGRIVSGIVAERLATHMVIEPLSVEDHAELVTAVLGHVPSPRLLTLLMEHSEGNPFVTEELLGAMAGAGHLQWKDGRWREQPHATLHVPLSLRMAVFDRLRLLSPSARETLKAAALIGRDFSFDMLQRVTGLIERDLVSVLRQAIHQQLLVEVAAAHGVTEEPVEERYFFRHGLTVEVIKSEMLMRERRVIHRRIAAVLKTQLLTDIQSLDRGTMGDHLPAAIVAKIACHLSSAGLLEQARAYALSAADDALRAGGLSAGVRYLEIALAGTQPGDPERVTLLERIGRMRCALSEIELGMSGLDEARREAELQGWDLTSSAIEMELGFWLRYIDPIQSHTVLRALVGRTLERFNTETGVDPDVVRLYAGASLACAIFGGDVRHADEANVWAERAIEAAKHLSRGQEHHLWRAFAGRGLSYIDGGQFTEGLADLQHAFTIGIRQVIPEAVVFTADALVSVLSIAGEREAAGAICAQVEQFDDRTGCVCTSPMSVYWHLLEGRWIEGDKVARSLLSRLTGRGIPIREGMAHAALGHLMYATGAIDDAATCFEEASRLLKSSPEFGIGGGALWGSALVHAVRGDHSEAQDAFTRCCEWANAPKDRILALPLLMDGCLYFTERGDETRGRECADAVRSIQNIIDSTASAAAVKQCEGAIALTGPQHVSAAAILRQAASLWKQSGRPYFEARCVALVARALVDEKGRDVQQRALASAVLDDALERFMQLGACGEAERIRELRQRAGLMSRARRRRAVSYGESPIESLTARERDVLRLLAQGQTNREIARTLFIAESTAELHVSRILGKLDCGTRAQAAARAAVWEHAAQVPTQDRIALPV